MKTSQIKLTKEARLEWFIQNDYLVKRYVRSIKENLPYSKPFDEDFISEGLTCLQNRVKEIIAQFEDISEDYECLYLSEIKDMVEANRILTSEQAFRVRLTKTLNDFRNSSDFDFDKFKGNEQKGNS